MTTHASSWRQIGTNIDVVVSNAPLEAAVRSVEATIDSADRTFSRFRSDSELSLLNRSSGRRIRVSESLALAVATALDAAELTDGLVDPSVGRAVRLTGYDRDFSLAHAATDETPAPWQFVAVPGWRAVDFDRVGRTIRLPRGVELDLDSTGKALIVDLAARAAAATLSVDAGVLV